MFSYWRGSPNADAADREGSSRDLVWGFRYETVVLVVVEVVEIVVILWKKGY